MTSLVGSPCVSGPIKSVRAAWMSEWVSEWMSEWVSEWVKKKGKQEKWKNKPSKQNKHAQSRGWHAIPTQTVDTHKWYTQRHPLSQLAALVHWKQPKCELGSRDVENNTMQCAVGNENLTDSFADFLCNVQWNTRVRTTLCTIVGTRYPSFTDVGSWN